MIRTDRLVIVEGKYDKIRLEGLLDAFIITTDGFSIFKDKQKTDFIKRYARQKGILILTDSDAAGFRIRNYIASLVPSECILNAYIPDILGKEKRKSVYSAEGKIGVEGMESEILINALHLAGIAETPPAKEHTSSYNLYELGLFGTANARQKRMRLIQALRLPERISKNNLLKYINRNLSKQEFEMLIQTIQEDNYD